jgi:hypothetical protein
LYATFGELEFEYRGKLVLLAKNHPFVEIHTGIEIMLLVESRSFHSHYLVVFAEMIEDIL